MPVVISATYNPALLIVHSSSGKPAKLVLSVSDARGLLTPTGQKLTVRGI